MPENQTLDMQAIAALRELSPDAGGEFLRELIDVYLQDTPLRLAELKEAMDRKDVSAFTRAAHTIKGSSSNFGATQFTKLAHEMEMQGKAADLSTAPESFDQLSLEYALVAQALAQIARDA